ncbi:hypothetical protein FF011L_04040 [Roseimaritima multifibrata]|uniref:Uncharacterized protein n=1 Tax=Roseimaritima multifibrata TaxID=1930274 RepID=A0A517M9W3_9BACT|nr:DUF1580 domain-containing protein [Roseimaritima multifibrata]QDS91672.1 hypothetical protein FF011L_04040 [Roseimaritima multifibrata]
MITASAGMLRLLDAIRVATGLEIRSETALRWCRQANKHGVKLEAWKIGNRVYSTVEAVRRFVEQNTLAMSSSTPAPQVNRSSERLHNKAMKELDDLGF